jgi:bacterioferritin-associated ferredoxin
MIVCSCNVLSEARIRAVLDHPQPPQRVLEVHHRLGCRPQCGCCVRAILDIMRDSQVAASCHGVCAADGAAA